LFHGRLVLVVLVVVARLRRPIDRGRQLDSASASLPSDEYAVNREPRRWGRRLSRFDANLATVFRPTPYTCLVGGDCCEIGTKYWRKGR
jgi:hypothetical protein